MKLPITYRILTLMLFWALPLSFYSCRDDSKTMAIVTVENLDKMPVPDAKVRVFGKPSDTMSTNKEIRFDEEKKTDSDGEVSFDFTEYFEYGQAGFTVLNLEVSKGNDSSAVEVEDYIEVKEQEDNTKTVEIPWTF